MINKTRLIKLTQDLIRIDSQNPGGNEAGMARFVRNYLAVCGIRPKIYEFKKNRSNVVAVIPGRKNNHSLLITPHLDTVPEGKSWHLDPFSAIIKDGRIYGLGATDCKGNLAVALEAIKSLFEDRVNLDYNLVFTATADEECGSELGLRPLLDRGILRADAAVVLDADDFNIVVTQKGLMHLKVKLQGKRAHGAYPWRGINAIEAAAEIIGALKKKRFSFVKNNYLRPPTVNVGTIRGGDKVNIVADWCELELDFRFLPGMNTAVLLRTLKNIIRKNIKKFKVEVEGIQPPYVISEEHPLVEQLSQVLRKWNVKPVLKGSEGATVIAFFQEKGIAAVATGFGSSGCAHTADEYVRIGNLYKGAIILEEFLKNYRFS